jgi:hypothetical protein
MPYIVQATESNNPEVEEGKYRAVILDMVPESGQFGENIRWKFQLQDEPYVGVELSSMSSPTLTPNSKIWPWYVALGFNIEVGMEFDLFSAIGLECYVMVDRKPSKKDPSIIYSNVTKIVPPPKVGPVAHVAHQPAPAYQPAPAQQGHQVHPQAPRTGAAPARPVTPTVRSAGPAPGAPAPGRPAAPRSAARPAGTGDGHIPF